MHDKNRFLPENRFIGDIEDGKRYPYGCYTKEESDARYASKETEANLNALAAVVAGKADESECIAIRARLDALESKNIKILTFSASPTYCERGSVNTITLAWALNKAATAQTINGATVSGNNKQYTGVTTDAVYTLTVSDEKSSDSKTVGVKFANHVYWGAATNLSAVTSLHSILSDEAARTITVDAGIGQYIVYAIPERLGDVTFFVEGFEGGFEPAVEQALTNEAGYEETYKIYRSTRANLGETVVNIREV